MPVIVIAPRDPWLERTVSNVQEVAARGGRIVLIGDDEAKKELATELEGDVLLKPMAPDFSAIVYAVPVQLLAYHAAAFIGKDVDQPRKLAKSVTVE